MAAPKTISPVMTVSASWQALFITATLFGWLSLVMSTLLSYAQSGYFSTGTWIFQISVWLHQLLFFVVAFLLLAHYRPAIKRIFMACLAMAIGVALYSVVAIWEHQLWMNYYSFYHPIAESDTSLWTAFGNEWALMLASLGVFGLGLYFTTRKSRR